MTPEFSRPERLDAIGAGERAVHIIADAAERAGVASRFGLIAIDRLEANLTLRRDASGIAVRGRVTGAVTQACTVTDAPLPATVDEPVALLFVEALSGQAEVELEAGALDMVEIEGGTIDLGEVAAETLVLALDPFPRSPEAADLLKAAGVISEDEAGPFGALKDLKAMLAGK